MSFKDSYNQKTILLINLILTEVFLVVLSSMFIFLHFENLWGVSVAFLARVAMLSSVVAAVIALFLIRELNRLTEKEQEARVNEVLVREGQETIDLLRSRQHDQMNHLQVMLGMLQLNRQESALEYVQEVIGDLKTETRISNIDNPVLAALFIKKGSQAEQRGVKLDITMESQLDKIPLSISDLARVMGNLLDNAICAASSQAGEGQVQLKLAENKRGYEISVSNNGAVVPDSLKEMIFEKGFSTKEGDGRGFGLYIVRNLVEGNGGTVSLSSDEINGTTFEIAFPR